MNVLKENFSSNIKLLRWILDSLTQSLSDFVIFFLYCDVEISQIFGKFTKLIMQLDSILVLIAYMFDHVDEKPTF